MSQHMQFDENPQPRAYHASSPPYQEGRNAYKYPWEENQGEKLRPLSQLYSPAIRLLGGLLLLCVALILLGVMTLALVPEMGYSILVTMVALVMIILVATGFWLIFGRQRRRAL
jgi:cell division protein FtsW (lipid II flippase)